MSPDGPVRGASFGAGADDYDRWRPEYPEDAVDWALPPGSRDVLDLGAGTGKLTGSLEERGLRVTAVDIDDRMLAALHARFPAVAALSAPAEALPLPDASVDGVLVADAWHWFDHEAAAREAARVLRPDGWLALLWHQPGAADGWTGEIARLDPNFERRYASDRDLVDLPSVRQEDRTFAWQWRVTPQHVRAVLGTRSSFSTLDDGERGRRLDQAERIADAAARDADDGLVVWPHTTRCVRCFVRDGRG